MNRGILAVAAVALLALLAWVALGGAAGAPDALPISPFEPTVPDRPTPAVVDAIGAEEERDDAALLTGPMQQAEVAADGEAGSLRVRVVKHDGVPLPFVTVVVVPPFVADARLDEQNVVTDERGEAQFALPSGSYTVRTSLGASARVVVQRGGNHELELALPATPLVRGLVVDENSTPVADAEVLVLGLTAVGTARVSARSNADGSFELPGIGAGRQVAARKSGFAPSTRRLHWHRPRGIVQRLWQLLPRPVPTRCKRDLRT